VYRLLLKLKVALNFAFEANASFMIIQVVFYYKSVVRLQLVSKLLNQSQLVDTAHIGASYPAILELL